MATLSYTAAQIDTLLGKADTAVQPATTGDLSDLATSTKTDLVSAINETFTSASNGKTAIAAAITGKGVPTSSSDSFATMAANITAIPTGSSSEPEKAVNFIDYDGTILHSYSAADFLNLSALPSNPSHDGLTAQGWNWALNDAKVHVSLYGELNIGQMYVTTSGDTEIDIELVAPRLSPYLGIAVNGTVDVDWGDNSTHSTVTGTSLTTQIRTLHDYSAAGAYTIKIKVTSGSFSIYGTSTYPALNNNSSSSVLNRVYSCSVMAVRLGNNVKIGNYGFYYFTNLLSVTLPDGTTIGNNAFQYCYSIKNIVFPTNITLGTSAIQGCNALKTVSLPKGVSSAGSQVFTNDYSLRTAPIFDGLGTLPDGLFNGCSALSKIIVPSNISTLGTSAFSGCAGLGAIHFKGTTPPTVSNTNTFNSLSTDCKIYVPTGYLSAYTSANNYPSSSTYTYVEE